MKKEILHQPELNNYLNVHQYLKDLYQFRKAKDLHFSYDVWAQELDIKSRSYLRLVVHGKRQITDKFIALYIKRSALEPAEAEHFRFLVAYTQSATIEERQFYGKKLMRSLKKKFLLKEIKSHNEFISDPFLVRLLTLLGFEDIHKNEESLQLATKTTLAQIRESLFKLESLGFIEQKAFANEGRTEWVAKTKEFKVPEDLGSSALEAFHTKSLNDAISAQKLPHQLRRFRSLLVGLSEEDLTSMLEEINNFAQDILAKYLRSEIVGKHLFQLNINVFPVSEKIENR